MPRFLLLTAMCLLAIIAIAQDPCSDDVIMSRMGKWAKHPDVGTMSDKIQLEINTRTDFISKLFQSAYPQPKGIEAAWYRNRGNSSVVPNGPIPYNFTSLYFSYYCNQYAHKMMLGGETGTWAYAEVNSMGWFLSNQHVFMKIDNNNTWMLPRPSGEWKGYPTYDVNFNGRSSCAIITHNGQLPWKPVTQGQYLQALRAQLEDQKNKAASASSEQEENIRKSMADNQNSKYLKEADKQKINADLQKMLDKMQSSPDRGNPKLVKSYEDKISLIDDYMNRTGIVGLQQPAILSNKGGGIFNGSFSTEQSGGQMLVTINEDYFNTTLPKYIPQLIVLYWKWEKSTPAVAFIKELEEKFPIEKLVAMIDK